MIIEKMILSLHYTKKQQHDNDYKKPTSNQPNQQSI